MGVREASAVYADLSLVEADGVDAIRPGYKQTEIGVIPEDWSISTVGKEFSIQLGKMLDAEKNHGVPKPFIGNRAVQWGQIDLSSIGSIKLTSADLQRYRLREGDLLVCEGGEVGRSAAWRAPVDECYYQKALHRLRPKRGYDVSVMLNVLFMHASSGLLQNYVTQTSIAHLPKEKFELVPIPLPSKVEQEAIADALNDADALIESLQQLIAKKRQIKQGAMQALLTGQQRLSGFAKAWASTRLGDVVSFYKGKGLPKSALDPFGAQPCIHYGELFTRYGETIHKTISRTNLTGDCFRSNANDVVMPTSDVTPTGLARASCVDLDGVILGGDILVIRADSRLMSGTFLSYVIRHEQEQILQLVTGTTVFHLYASDMRKFTFPMPTLDEQKAIVGVLDSVEAEITALETRLSKTREIKQGMMQALLTGAIRLPLAEVA
ncbi:restriction endonuclease subunit S [Novilysobacter erysipheiresistens]|uniref:Restriction endonuclease subunit S n=1 Tax=Novilysobacter erysipheiresistens TaxID=1749332 RepID=A0ABU7YWW5_9GAMM